MAPHIRVAHYESKVSIINILSSYHGFENEDPYNNLDEFLDVCGTMRINNVDDDAM